MSATSTERAAEPMPLTSRQRELLSYLYTFTREKGFQPSYRDIMERFEFASPNAIQGHLRLLAKKGWIAITPRDSRAVRFLFRPDGRRFEGFADR